MTMTVHSDTVNSMTAPPSAAIVRRAAATAILDARAAWKEARATPDEERVRDAFRRCVLAARLVRRAAGMLRGVAQRRWVKSAELIEATANDLKVQLARIVEGDGEVQIPGDAERQ